MEAKKPGNIENRNMRQNEQSNKLLKMRSRKLLVKSKGNAGNWKENKPKHHRWIKMIYFLKGKYFSNYIFDIFINKIYIINNWEKSLKNSSKFVQTLF